MHRIGRVEEAIKEAVALILQRELKDPRVGMVTITRVRVTADLRQAVIYFSVLAPPSGVGPKGRPAGIRQRSLADTPGGGVGRDPVAGVEAGLKSATPYIRRLLGERLRLRFTPALKFQYDPSVEESIRIQQLMQGGTGDRGQGA